MVAEVLRVLTATTIATTLALALIGLLRKPLRLAAGAQVAYWLWLLVPALVAAVLLPAPPAPLLAAVSVLPARIDTAFTAITAGNPASSRALLIDLALVLWSVGTLVMLLAILVRQRSLVRTFGALTRDADNLYHGAVTAPMVVGAWHPKIIVPLDFEARYPPAERELVIAHERAHAARHDVAVNAIASLSLCVFWFNPLMYRALSWLRADQELACDAQVLLRLGDVRRRYADALLNTQLASEAVARLILGCHWKSTHPLKERVAMIKRPLPARGRRLAGFAFIAAFSGVATYAAWTAQPAIAAGPPILVDYDIRITNPHTHELREMKTQYLVHSGETIKDERDGLPLLKADTLRFGCTPYLADAPGRSTDWSTQKARGIPMPAAGQILLDCPIFRDGAVVQSPAVTAKDGDPVALEFSENAGANRYRLEVTASTSPQKIAAAKVASDQVLAAKKRPGK
jgi:beta-lactamase regulating signal transducer with metallopeptidase domain